MSQTFVGVSVVLTPLKKHNIQKFLLEKSLLHGIKAIFSISYATQKLILFRSSVTATILLN